MRYYVLFILTLFCVSFLSAQDQDRVRIVSSSHSNFINQKALSSIQPVYAHKGSTLTADSGILYEDEIGRQFFEAFGKVVITQPDGTIIYADRLHYDATPQIATLTNNVRMVDASSVLTTNHLIYKMRDKIGTYTGGGRIITRNDTITSKNGYYFENTQDAYFRNQVVVRTAEAKIYTDTMRYNSTQRMTYFFGPTNIKGNKGENLYTEKGDYHTELGIAKFSKNNLYTEGARFLKGDSLYYERNSGVGKAFRNVVFVDTTDKFYAYGGYGLYNQADGSITMTDNPLVITVVQNDSTENTPPDSVIVSTDLPRNIAEKDRLETSDEKVATEENILPTNDSLTVKPSAKVDSVYLTADTLFSKLILLKDYKPLHFNLDRDGGELEVDDDIDYGDGEDADDLQDARFSNLETDSIASLTDSLRVDIDSLKIEEPLQKPEPPKIPDSENKKPTTTQVPKKEEGMMDIGKNLKQDSIIRRQAVIPMGGEADSLMNEAINVAQTPDTTYKLPPDSLALDTARTRIVKAYYNVRMFKSDLQAVADSVYYGMADSMFRFMGKPMIWAEGSQISSDTIYLQMLHQKLDNALLVGNAFMVNTVLDTVKFNQLKGRKITAFFANNSIDRLFVDGNAENLVFQADEKRKIITEMFHDRGARIKIKMEDKKIIDYITIRKVDQKVYPFALVTQENEVLPGFIWRPQDRPKSKEDMMSRKREIEKASDLPPDGTEIEKPSETAQEETTAEQTETTTTTEELEETETETEHSSPKEVLNRL